MVVHQAIGEMTIKAEPMEFRPARPPLRKLWPLGILSPLFLMLAPRILKDPKPWDVVGLIGVALLIAGGIWLWFRQRFPGDPVLRVDAAGMSYVRGGRERGLKWKEITAIQVDFTLDRMLFIPTSDQKPIVMHPNMVSADGRPWAMLIENYWRSPENRRRQNCG
jgi:hypothetical protein